MGSGTHHKVQTIADPKLLSCLTFGEVRQHIQKSNSRCGMRTKPSTFFSVLPVIKYSDQNNPSEKGFSVAPSSRSWWGSQDGQRLKQRVPSQPQSGNEGSKIMLTSFAFSTLYSLGPCGDNGPARSPERSSHDS